MGEGAGSNPFLSMQWEVGEAPCVPGSMCPHCPLLLHLDLVGFCTWTELSGNEELLEHSSSGSGATCYSLDSHAPVVAVVVPMQVQILAGEW